MDRKIHERMRKPTLLVIEDDPDIVELLRYNLEREGYRVLCATDGERGLGDAARHQPDLVLLDLMLPGMDGLEVCKRLRAQDGTRGIPVLMLTAKSEETDVVIGLEMGADDYLTKPFSPRELVARVRAALRRNRPEGPAAAKDEQDVYRGKHLLADFDAVSVSVDGAQVRLTRREFELLQFLVQNRNRVISRDRLLERVWGYDHAVETRSVDVHVGRLRGKLGAAAGQIETVVGLGYRFVE